MKRPARVGALLLALALLMSLAGCARHRYDEGWILGKTSAEVEARYGPFAISGLDRDEDGRYRSCLCGYVIKEKRVGALGTDPEILFVIHFNAEGIAVETKVAPGGWGG